MKGITYLVVYVMLVMSVLLVSELYDSNVCLVC